MEWTQDVIKNPLAAQFLRIVLGVLAAYGLLFGPIVIIVGTFSGPQILIPGILHVVVGLICLVLLIQQFRTVNK